MGEKSGCANQAEASVSSQERTGPLKMPRLKAREKSGARDAGEVTSRGRQLGEEILRKVPVRCERQFKTGTKDSHRRSRE